MPYAEVRDRMVACGLWIYTHPDHGDVRYELGHVTCEYPTIPNRINYHLVGYAMLDRSKTISGEQFVCTFCDKVMGPEADSVRSAATGV